MKKTIAISAIIIASLATIPAIYAISMQSKQKSVFTATAISGAILGGPIGFFLGALGGTYVGEQIDKTDKIKIMQWKLEEAETHIAELYTQLARAKQGHDLSPFSPADTDSEDLAQLY